MAALYEKPVNKKEQLEDQSNSQAFNNINIKNKVSYLDSQETSRHELDTLSKSKSYSIPEHISSLERDKK